jgi:hypothetical protein
LILFSLIFGISKLNNEASRRKTQRAEPEKMKLLPERLKKNDFLLTLERRNKKAAIYRQVWAEKENAAVAYEVILPEKRTTAYIAGGGWQTVDPYETYPRSEKWGERGWTYKAFYEGCCIGSRWQMSAM